MTADITLIPTIVAGTIVSIFSAIATWLVKKGVDKLGDVATKSFVIQTIDDHEIRMRSMFTRDKFQQIVNNDIEFRLRRVEAATGIDLTRPPIITTDTESEEPGALKRPEGGWPKKGHKSGD